MLSPAQKTFPTQVSVLQITKGEKTILQFGRKKTKNTSKTCFFPFHGRRGLVHLPKPPTINGLCEAEKKRAQPKLAKVRVVSDDIK